MTQIRWSVIGYMRLDVVSFVLCAESVPEKIRVVPWKESTGFKGSKNLPFSLITKKRAGLFFALCNRGLPHRSFRLLLQVVLCLPFVLKLSVAVLVGPWGLCAAFQYFVLGLWISALLGALCMPPVVYAMIHILLCTGVHWVGKVAQDV